MKGVFGIIFTFCFYSVFAQDMGRNTGSSSSLPPPTYLRDVFSTPIDPKPYKGIEGSPFLDDKWLLARIKVAGNAKTYDSISIKLNVYKNAIHFINADGEEMQMAVKIEAVKIIDPGSVWNNTVFLSNFDQLPGFYQVLEDGGKLKLLKRLWMFVWETQPLNSEKLRKFELQGDLYLSSGTMLHKPSKACSTIRDAFGQNDKLLDYISQNNLHCNKEEDMRQIVKFSASLK